MNKVSFSGFGMGVSQTPTVELSSQKYNFRKIGNYKTRVV